MAKAKAKAKALRPAAVFARNAELEARLLANPHDAETRAVFADWLQAQGDDWGEMIALADAGKASTANKRRAALGASLTGGIPARAFTWGGGFVDIVRLTGALADTELAPLLELRTLVLARALYIARVLEPAEIRQLSYAAPRGLAKLFTWLSNACGQLAHSALRRLQLYVPKRTRLDPAKFAALFAGDALPALRHLEIYDAPLPLPWLTALVESKLVQRLSGLELYQGALDKAGTSYLVKARDKLAHLTYMKLDDTAVLKQAFRVQLRAAASADRDDIV